MKGCTYCGSDEHNTANCPMRASIAGPVYALIGIVGLAGFIWIWSVAR